MRATLRALRALRALVLLAGFPLLSLLPVAGLAALCWAAHLGAPTGVAVKLYVVSAVLAFLALRGLFMLRTPPGTSPAPGLSVTEDGEPALWRTVRELAEGTGTPAPAAVVLTGDAAASLSEDTRPRLLLGMPLIQGLSESQLRAVLAQEFARHAGHGLTGRCRTRVLLAVAGFRKDGGQSYRVMARGYTAYAKLYVRATLADTRRQEYEADAVAARLAGRDATASALREIPALRDAHDYYLGHYAELGHAAGLLPPPGEILGGFGRMLTARELELASLRMRHCDPTTAERVKRVKALPADGRTAEGKGAALSLLTDADRTYAELEAALLDENTRALPRAEDWQHLLDAAMRARLTGLDTPVHQALAAYTGEQSTLRTLLKVIDDGQLWRLAQRLPLSDQAAAASGRAFREFARPALRRALRGMVLAELSALNRLRWEFSWSEADPNPLMEGGPARVVDAVDAAVADSPDTAPLRALLLPSAPPAPPTDERTTS
jgi:Zn-dependent protease with chaperone function